MQTKTDEHDQLFAPIDTKIRTLETMSAECGAMYNFEITKVDATTHVLDSVVLVTPLVDNVTRVTLRIYFPTP